MQAESSEPELAAEALRRIGELYAIEKQTKDLDVEARRAVRERESRPRLLALREWLAKTRTQVLDKGAMAGAIDYTFSNWDALVRYLEDGRLAPDNNQPSEPFAVSRWIAALPESESRSHSTRHLRRAV